MTTALQTSGIPAALAPLSQYKQFIVYMAVPDASRPGKTNKYPIDAVRGYKIDGQDATAHMTFPVAEDAVRSLQSQTHPQGTDYGVGFVITEKDPFWCLDIDACLVNGAWSSMALDLCNALAGAAVEVSRSGTGLHIWGSGHVPAHSCKNKALDIELYDSGRFIALGMPNSSGDVGVDMTLQISAVVAKYFPPGMDSSSDGLLSNEPCEEWNGPADDEKLIARFMASKSASMVGKCTIQQLWVADIDAMSRTYPDPSNDAGYGASEADAALAAHLAWWTGKDGERIKRLMLLSGLMRDKYHREDYLPRTIAGACSVTKGAYCEKAADGAATKSELAEVLGATEKGRLVNGHVFSNPEDQLELWKGYTYIAEANAILTDTGMLLAPDGFKGKFGGMQYIMDSDNSKVTANAFEAFTQSRAVRQAKADHTAFRPEKEPGTIWVQDGETFANTFRKLDVEREAGDVTLFLTHLAKLLPTKRDRDIMLSYMAAVVQYQGVKFQWAPLVQGVEGNGKTLLSRCVSKAVGWKYTHEAKASEIAEKYNSWLVGTILITVEDVYTIEGKAEVFETLKPMITNSRLPIRAMRAAERTMDICANFMLNTNHKDAIRKTANDRRICNLYTAQQYKEDLERDGMDTKYFQTLYGWLDNGGYAAVSEYLYTYEIPAEFGLEECLLSRAPETSSTAEAIEAGLGRVEQEVSEAIIQGGTGFAGGWVSSNALDNLLRAAKMDLSVPRNKRRDMMRTLGYEWHPHLNNGRMSTALPDGTKPTLYIKIDHPLAGLQTTAEISKAYQAAQKPNALGIVAVAKSA